MSHKTYEEIVAHARNSASVIALIYSPIELQEYLVEIISKDSDKLIKKHHQMPHFHSVDEALSHATDRGAEAFFLCVDNTYDECSSLSSGQSLEYIPLCSKYKR